MIHKVLEELFDTLLFFVGVLGILIFFLLYWKSSFQIRYAEVVLQDFLGKIAVTGKVTKEDYEGLQRSLYEIDTSYELKMQWFQYEEQPVYSLISKDELSGYFKERNNIKPVVLKEYTQPLLQGPEEELKLQTETNASVLAAVQQDYLPLPVENKEIEISAVRPWQEVYVDEKLITVCKVISSDKSYYVEALDVIAKESGETNLDVVVEDVVYKVPVQVICHPRTVQCENGHTVLNEKEIINERKQTGKISCPYCKELPERISCGISELRLKTGEELAGSNIEIEVFYADGSTGYITPESKEWQDNYDKEFCGKQIVTIRYRNAETQIVVISENSNCNQCGKECNDRCREDYLDYPYCLDCLADLYIFTGQIQVKEKIIAGKELLSLLDKESEILFSRGDFIMLEYGKGRNKTVLQRKVTIAETKRN